MKNKILCMLILFCIPFCVSCQVNSDSQLIEKKETSREWSETKKQPPMPDFIKKSSIVISDPYKDVWNAKNNYKDFLSRFYKDLNHDGIPELFIKWNESYTGEYYVIYRILKSNYLYLGSILFSSFQLLNSDHFGNQDIMVFSKSGVIDNGKQKGWLEIYESNGLTYISLKELKIDLVSAIQEKLLTPDKTYTLIKHPIGNTLFWSPKDDDKYRKMIK